VATSGGKTLLKQRLNSRPERRILAPLPATGLSAPVTLSVEPL